MERSAHFWFLVFRFDKMNVFTFQCMQVKWQKPKANILWNAGQIKAQRHTHTHNIGSSDLCEFLKYSLLTILQCITSKVSLVKIWNEQMTELVSMYIFQNVHIFQSVLITSHCSPFIMLYLVISFLTKAAANIQQRQQQQRHKKKNGRQEMTNCPGSFNATEFWLHALFFIVAHFYDGTSTKFYPLSVQCPQKFLPKQVENFLFSFSLLCVLWLSTTVK